MSVGVQKERCSLRHMVGFGFGECFWVGGWDWLGGAGSVGLMVEGYALPEEGVINSHALSMEKGLLS